MISFRTNLIGICNKLSAKTLVVCLISFGTDLIGKWNKLSAKNSSRMLLHILDIWSRYFLSSPSRRAVFLSMDSARLSTCQWWQKIRSLKHSELIQGDTYIGNAIREVRRRFFALSTAEKSIHFGKIAFYAIKLRRKEICDWLAMTQKTNAENKACWLI